MVEASQGSKRERESPFWRRSDLEPENGHFDRESCMFIVGLLIVVKKPN